MDFEEINLLMKEGAAIIRNLHAENRVLKQNIEKLEKELILSMAKCFALEKGQKMTKSQLIAKLNEAQELLSDVYHWADSEGISHQKVNSQIADLMSCADDCIIDAIRVLDK